MKDDGREEEVGCDLRGELEFDEMAPDAWVDAITGDPASVGNVTMRLMMAPKLRNIPKAPITASISFPLSFARNRTLSTW